MSTVSEIKAAIDALPTEQRAEIQRWLSERKPRQPAPPTKLPDQAARRRRILGNKILPNLVLQARDADAR